MLWLCIQYSIIIKILTDILHPPENVQFVIDLTKYL